MNKTIIIAVAAIVLVLSIVILIVAVVRDTNERSSGVSSSSLRRTSDVSKQINGDNEGSVKSVVEITNGSTGTVKKSTTKTISSDPEDGKSYRVPIQVRIVRR